MSKTIECMPVFDDVADMRAQALKVLEEASELCEAVKWCAACNAVAVRNKTFTDMLDEMADVYQTLANLRASFGVTDDELEQAVCRCIERNEARGRYGKVMEVEC